MRFVARLGFFLFTLQTSTNTHLVCTEQRYFCMGRVELTVPGSLFRRVVHVGRSGTGQATAWPPGIIRCLENADTPADRYVFMCVGHIRRSRCASRAATGAALRWANEARNVVHTPRSQLLLPARARPQGKAKYLCTSIICAFAGLLATGSVRFHTPVCVLFCLFAVSGLSRPRGPRRRSLSSMWLGACWRRSG